MKGVKCADCAEYRNEWCEKVVDSPCPEMIRDCQYYHEKDRDVVNVIRCKDCKHRPKGTGANHDLEFPDYVCPCQCEDYYYSWMPKDDWFCRDGEREEE